MLELNHQFRVVDVHTRLAAARESPGRTVSPEDLQREAHQAGVVRSVVFPGANSDGEGYVKANNAVARQAVERPMVAFARISGPREPGGTASRLRNIASRRADAHTSPEDIEQYAYDDRFHGFKLAPAVDGLPDAETLAALEEVDLPVVVHGGRRFPPEDVAETLLDRSFPVVLAHFGGYPLDRALMDRAIEYLERYDTLYLDTSAVRFRAQLERAIMEHPDRVLFGSGAPSVHQSVAVMEVLTLDIPEDSMRRVFSANPGRVVEPLAPDYRSS